MQTKTIQNPTLFGVPSGRIFPLLPIPVERNELGMGWAKLCVYGRKMGQDRMNLKQQKDDRDLVSRCTNLEQTKLLRKHRDINTGEISTTLTHKRIISLLLYLPLMDQEL